MSTGLLRGIAIWLDMMACEQLHSATDCNSEKYRTFARMEVLSAQRFVNVNPSECAACELILLQTVYWLCRPHRTRRKGQEARQHWSRAVWFNVLRGHVS